MQAMQRASLVLCPKNAKCESCGEPIEVGDWCEGCAYFTRRASIERANIDRAYRLAHAAMKRAAGYDLYNRRLAKIHVDTCRREVRFARERLRWLQLALSERAERNGWTS